MEKQNAMYYHCPRCGEWIPGTQYRCRCGQNLFGLPLEILPDESNPMERRTEGSWENPAERRTEGKGGKLTGRRIEAGIGKPIGFRTEERGENPMERRTEESAPQRVCTDCGNAYFTYERNCPACGGLLTIAPEKEPPRSVHTLPSVPASDEEEYSDHVDTDMIYEEEESEEKETPLYFFNATRYENGGVPINSMYMNIPIEDGMVMGRNLFLTDNRLFFPMPTKKLDEHYRNISTYNVQLNVREGNLFVQYCPSKPGKMKVRVYVNEKPLEDGKEERLYPGDLLRFGGSKKADRVIDIRIAAAGAVWREAGERQVLDKEMREQMETVQKSLQDISQLVQDYGEESRQGFGRMDDGFGRADQGFGRMDAGLGKIDTKLEHLQEELRGIMEAVEKITSSDLELREGESAENFEERLRNLIPFASEKAKENLIREFCAFTSGEEEEEEERRTAMFQFFTGTQARKEGIYQTAVIETVCRSIGWEDYSSTMFFFGRTMEGFVMGEMFEMIKTAGWKPEIISFEGKGNNNGKYNGKNHWKNNEKKPDVNEILNWFGEHCEEIIKTACRNQAGQNDQDHLKRDIRKGVGALHAVRRIRNRATHPGADTEGMELKKVTREDYYNVKRKLLDAYREIGTIQRLCKSVAGGTN